MNFSPIDKSSKAFNHYDKLQVRRAVSKLSPIHQRIIFLRFWENYSIEDIAKEMRIEWNEAYRSLEDAIDLLRSIFLSEQEERGLKITSK